MNNGAKGALYLKIKTIAPLSGCMTMWEYKVVGHSNNKKLEVELNKLGKEGWEVVAGGVGSWPNSQFVMKRPV